MNKKKTVFSKVEHKGHDINFHYEQTVHEKKEDSEELEKKYNVKIRKQDLMLLDIISKKLDTPRNTLINLLIEAFLVEGLMAIEHDDVRALIAEKADELANTTYNSSWQETILKESRYIPRTISVMKKCNVEGIYEPCPQFDENGRDCWLNSSSYKKVLETLNNKNEA